jgi:hypothetical protein
MKKLPAIVLLSAFALTVSAATDTMWPNNPGRGTMDTSLVTKTESHPLEKHLQDMEVSFVLTKTDGVPNRLIVMSGSPEQYSDVDFLCRMAKEYGGVNKTFVYKTVDGKTVRTSKDCS